ncbi:cell envelope biogenesis protein OmpA [uncultured Maribacter sp.]|uniref:cell envelope biogenesis protein OmpA n=1 Tax=uncultured Maribacter sp. TaxID=431308 RepID=UPI002621C283|nr:cell envelope biogenesis protein OmpA [uncultured Maribacter sp.]
MKHKLTYIKALACIFLLCCFTKINAQETGDQIGPKKLKYRTNIKAEQYAQLKELGYSDVEIYQDLGNANFLSNNYENALFWYSKLQKIKGLSPTYQERFTHALSQTSMPTIAATNSNKDWLAQIKRDYELDKNPRNKRFKKLNFLNNNTSSLNLTLEKKSPEITKNIIDKSIEYKNAYETPISVTADGKTAYFSKPTAIKPSTGVFSKMQIVHKTYSAKKVNGKWTEIKEIVLCPKRYSSVHPTVSADGRRLFFASNMPGTFGKYDIYVSDMQSDGSFGIAKNLGTKVNTKKNDLYPKLVNGTSLLFASDGRKGFGGLDVYMVQVQKKKVGWATNLGTSINSNKDDFAIALNGNGQGYVVSNRGNSTGELQHIAFSLKPKRKDKQDNLQFNPIDVLTTHATNTDYTSSIFEDEQP